jgi:hypothetical protein
MSEYAVNRQTGEVLKRDQSGSWQKVKSAKNASGEILINEGSGWGAVPSAAAQPAPPASPFLQRGMGMVQGAMATPPREPAAWEAGAREYVANMPERERAGIMSGGDAALFNIANTLTAGGLQRAGNQVVPGKNLGDAAVREGENYYPTESVIGRGVGYAAPAGVGGKVANMAIQDIVTATGARTLAPKALSEGTGALARGTRYFGRLGTLAPVGALQAGAFEGIVEQPVRDFMAGEESTVGGRVRAGVTALANPINYGVLPAASLVGRLGKSVVTGVATPGDVQRAVTRGSGGAVPLSEGQLAADAAQILDTQALNAIDPRGFKLVERILRQSGLSDSDIPAVNAKVRELLKAAPDAVAGRLTLGQVYAKALYDLDKTQAGENILKVLRERRNVTDVKDRSPSIVGNEVRDLRGSQVDFITQSAESNLGAGKRIDIKNAVAETKKQIGAEYERVLGEADPTRPEAGGIAMIVQSDPSKGILARRAKNAGFQDVDSYIAAMPDTAGHWLRSHLDTAARSAQGRERVDLENTVGQLDELLDTSPGYAATRRQYGTESGVDRAREIGSNFIAAARNQGNLDLLLEQIAGLPARERDVALLAIRDNLLSPVRGSGEDAPARISQLVSVGTLEGLEQLGPAGKGLADDIRAIRDENQFLGQIDSGNPLRQSATFSNDDARANAPDLYSGGIARTLNAGGGSSLPADIAISAITGTPIAPFTLAKIARGGLQSVFAPGRKSKEAMTQFLMSRPRNALPGSTPPAAAPPPQVPPGSAPVGAPASTTPIRTSGIVGSGDLTNAAVGAGLGGIAPAESPEERARNMAIGAGVGGFARRGSQMLDDATRTVGQPRATSGRTVGQGGYFGRQSMRPPGSGPSAREIETQQQWATATPIVTQARTTAQSAQQAADAALQSKAPADIARAKDAKKTLVGQIKEAQASRAGMDTPEDARLAETLASLTENTSDPVLLSTQISAAKTSLDRLLTDIGSPVEGNLIPVRTNILTRTQAPRSAAEGPQDRASVTRYAEGEAPPVKGMGFGASTPKTPEQAVRFETPGSPEWEAAVAKGLDMSQAGRMGRAEEMGFDTETVLYHGTGSDVQAFDTGKAGSNLDQGWLGRGVYMSTSPDIAGRYASRGMNVLGNASVMPLHIRGKLFEYGTKNKGLRGEFFGEESLPADIRQAVLERAGYRYDPAVEPDPVDERNLAAAMAEVLQERGFAGVKASFSDGSAEVVIFDPSNIRSVNAAFDPEKSGSSTLLAAAPFAAVSGAGLTLAGEDARNQRTVGKPKTSQSARTVGKAKTN